MPTTHRAGIEVKDMRNVQSAPWPHHTDARNNTYEFVDAEGGRTVRVVRCARLEPGELNHAAIYRRPRHRNQYDVLAISAQMRSSGAIEDRADPIGGVVMVRPEGLLFEGGAPDGEAALAPRSEHAQVSVFLHTNGPSGEPLITLAEVAEAVQELERDGAGRIDAANGEYIEPGGTVRELFEVCWETIMGRPFPYPEPPQLNVPLECPIAVYPWYPSRTEQGVQVKPFAALSALGPIVKLVKLDEGAKLDARTLENHRLLAILVGEIRCGKLDLLDLTVLFCKPGDELPSIVADRPSLIWDVQWRPKNCRLPIGGSRSIDRCLKKQNTSHARRADADV